MKTSDIPIASPCGQDWTTMKLGDRSRYCDACKKSVHDLSAMTKTEAKALLATPSTEGLCVRLRYDVHGDVVFRDTVPVTRLMRVKRAVAAMAALALPMSAAACMGAAAPPQAPTRMGAVAEPLPSATSSGGADGTDAGSGAGLIIDTGDAGAQGQPNVQPNEPAPEPVIMGGIRPADPPPSTAAPDGGPVAPTKP